MLTSVPIIANEVKRNIKNKNPRLRVGVEICFSLRTSSQVLLRSDPDTDLVLSDEYLRWSRGFCSRHVERFRQFALVGDR